MRTGPPSDRQHLESAKSHERRVREGWYEKYCPVKKNGIDIGCSFDPIHDHFDQWDMAFGDGDAVTMDGIASNTYHTVYTSHILEHVWNPLAAIRRWFDILAPEGHLIICVPHRDLYEKRLTLPSRFNDDHKTFWLPSRYEPPNTFSLSHTITDALMGREYELLALTVLNEGWEPFPPEVHSCGEYAIEAIILKLV